MTNYQKELEIAITAAKKAGDFLKQNLGQITITDYKEGTHNYATDQDIQSQYSIIQTLKEYFPDDQYLAEESMTDIDKSKRIWIIDPIDGTRNYANGLSVYSISIALWDKQEIKAAVVYAPNHNNELFTAIKGQGAKLNGQELERINPKATLSESLFSTAFPYNRNSAKIASERMLKILPKAADMMRLGSAALETCFVAAGRLGAYFEEELKPYDVAAAILIAEETGCLVTDYLGKPVDIFRKIDDQYNVQHLVTKNAEISREIIELII